MAGGRVFINYRRDDSRADAGRLYDRLSAHFPGKVFRDVASLEPGVEWHEAIHRVIGQSDACIVVVGKTWLTLTDTNGRRRLDDPRDTVRQEINAALQGQMRVFPVLVGGAKMPDEDDLPADLQPICRRNALEISEQDWDEGFRKLVGALEVALGIRSRQHVDPSDSRSLLSRAWPAFALAGVLVVAAGVFAVLHNWEGSRSPAPIIDLHPGGGGSAPDTSKPSGKSPGRADATVVRHDSGGASPSGGGIAPPPSYTEPPATLNPSALVGSWRSVSSGSTLVFFEDSSLLISRDVAAAVGGWRLGPSHQDIEFAANPITGGNAGFSRARCTVAPETGGDILSGQCTDDRRGNWPMRMVRSGRVPQDEIGPDIPGVDISRLSEAEGVQFARDLSRVGCTCGCGQSLLACRRNRAHNCRYSPQIVSQMLGQFLSLARQ